MRPDLRKRCPACASPWHIDISAMVYVRLKQYSLDGEDFGSDADESEDGSHEWDGTSGAHCAACGWGGRVSDLVTKDKDEEEEAK